MGSYNYYTTFNNKKKHVVLFIYEVFKYIIINKLSSINQNNLVNILKQSSEPLQNNVFKVTYLLK